MTWQFYVSNPANLANMARAAQREEERAQRARDLFLPHMGIDPGVPMPTTVCVIPSDPADQGVADGLSAVAQAILAVVDPIRPAATPLSDIREQARRALADFYGGNAWSPEEIATIRGDSTTSATAEASEPLTLDVIDRALTQAAHMDLLSTCSRLHAENAVLRIQLAEARAAAGWSPDNAPALGGTLAPTEPTP